MEDSRNIIKAIDALTLKAGGEKVDSKNITEAIDNLRAVYDQKAIAIDKTLTKEGNAADAKAVGELLTRSANNDALIPETDSITVSYTFHAVAGKMYECDFSARVTNAIDANVKILSGLKKQPIMSWIRQAINSEVTLQIYRDSIYTVTPIPSGTELIGKIQYIYI